MTQLPIKFSISYDKVTNFTELAFDVLGKLEYNYASMSLIQEYQFEHAVMCLHGDYDEMIVYIYPKVGFESKVSELILRWK